MTYSNLRKVCKQGSGDAIWVTDASVAKMQIKEFVHEEKDFKVIIEDFNN